MLEIMQITERKFYNGLSILDLKAENLLCVISNTSTRQDVEVTLVFEITRQRALVESSVDTWTNSG
jgi:hypothetical protein